MTDMFLLVVGQAIICWSPDYISYEAFVSTPDTKCIEFTEDLIRKSCIQDNFYYLDDLEVGDEKETKKDS